MKVKSMQQIQEKKAEGDKRDESSEIKMEIVL